MAIGTVIIDIKDAGSFNYNGHTYVKTDILKELVVGKDLKLILAFWQYLNNEGLNVDPTTYTEQELDDFGDAFLNPITP